MKVGSQELASGVNDMCPLRIYTYSGPRGLINVIGKLDSNLLTKLDFRGQKARSVIR